MDESLMTSESISISEPFEEIDSSDVPEVSETLSGPSKKSTNVDAKKDGGDETVGEEAEVHIAPRFAFGSLGMSEVNIPPDCKVMYFVKLLGVEREPDPQTLTPEERLSKGLHKKARGNFFYQRREFSSAVQCYRRALDYLDDNPETIGSSQTEGELLREQAEERIHVLFEERLKVENNLAVAQMNMEAYDGALSSLDRVLSCQPQNVKALFRKGKCLRLKGELDEAVQVLRRGLDVSPNEKPIQAELGLVLKKLKEENEKSKSMYQKMVGGMMNEGSSEEQKEDAKKKEKRGDETRGSAMSLWESLAFVTVLVFAVMWISAVFSAYYHTEVHYDVVGALTHIVVSLNCLAWGNFVSGRREIQAYLVIVWAARNMILSRFSERDLSTRELVGYLFWLIGFLVEVVADLQKKQWKEEPENRFLKPWRVDLEAAVEVDDSVVAPVVEVSTLLLDDVEAEEISGSLDGDLVVFISERSKGILQDVRGMRHKDQGLSSSVHSMRIVNPRLPPWIFTDTIATETASMKYRVNASTFTPSLLGTCGCVEEQIMKMFRAPFFSLLVSMALIVLQQIQGKETPTQEDLVDYMAKRGCPIDGCPKNYQPRPNLFMCRGDSDRHGREAKHRLQLLQGDG
ncbi:unnamed protein product [Cyprideis torosa]|uniref:peptidylprolyl isomerase n=1 Tax=Cyprideis torosa TaxID=163714 RepID=A0A7R8W4Z8_9CRUS|nr:unnamed protein product [Cyprideis torosa]CAG0884750.1 unnamed protein product [Cyprideis torosa]